MRRLRRTVAGAVLGIAALGAAAAPAAARPAAKTQKLHGVITIEFPDYQRTSGGCRADEFGNVARLQQGNRVRVYRGTEDGTSVHVAKKPLAEGKVGTGTIDDATDDCAVRFTVAKARVLPDDEFYVVEVKGIATTQTVSAARVEDGDLGAIPASI